MSNSATDLYARYHRLLGAFIAQTTEIEELLDSITTAYFEVGDAETEPFRRWVLSRVAFRDKLTLLKLILGDLEVCVEGFAASEFTPIRRDLSKIMERRNDLAHSHYRTVVDATDGMATLHLARVDRKRKSPFPDVQLDLDELESARLEAGRLTLGLGRVLAAAEQKRSAGRPEPT